MIINILIGHIKIWDKIDRYELEVLIDLRKLLLFFMLCSVILMTI